MISFSVTRGMSTEKNENVALTGRQRTVYSLRDSVNKLIVTFPRTSNFMKNSFSSLEQPAL